MRGGVVNRALLNFPEADDIYPVMLEGYSTAGGPTMWRARSAVTGGIWCGLDGFFDAASCEAAIRNRKAELEAHV